ncbi:MAG: hypothetical protein AAGF26_13920 [Cyanobacteria bacterium P01_G01_bin.49]
MIKILKKLEYNYTQWLSSPQINAAGRIGLFRILYSLYCLWFYSYFQFSEMSLVPSIQWHPIRLFSWFNAPPPPYVFPILESLLSASLILLLVGYKTRLATVLVFLFGSSLAGIRISFFMKDHVLMITAFYVPLFMIFSLWGSTYSIDAILKKRKGLFTPNPQDSSWKYFWTSRGLMVILAILFFSSGFAKIIKKQWVMNPDFVGNLMVNKTVDSYLSNGFPINPLSVFIGHHRFLSVPMQYGAIIFETLCILIIFSAIARTIFFYTAPFFHSFNTFFLGIPFAAVIGIYLAFPDWQVLYERFYPKYLRFNWLNKLSSPILIIGSIISCMVVGLTWNLTTFTRYLFSWGQLINYHTIWFIVFPVTIIWVIASLYRYYIHSVSTKH